MFSQREKDEIKKEAEICYANCYGNPSSDQERFYVMKGIEAMAAVIYDRIEYPRG